VEQRPAIDLAHWLRQRISHIFSFHIRGTGEGQDPAAPPTGARAKINSGHFIANDFPCLSVFAQIGDSRSRTSWMVASMPGSSSESGRHGDDGKPRSRRLTDKILNVFHHACDQGDLETAQKLLRIVEDILARPMQSPSKERRKTMEHLVAAHERLWTLRKPGGAIH
jgi:hypothetical protein